MPPIAFLLREGEEDKEAKENARAFVIDQFKSEGSRLLGAAKYEEARYYFKLSMFYYKEDKFTLINRSICNLKLGYYKQAMKEIDKVLSTNPMNVKALMQKGDIYYATGNLEWALSYYYRAKHLTKNFKRAHMWIYICHNHILENIGDSRLLLNTEGDMTFLSNQIKENNFSSSEKAYNEQKKENKNEKRHDVESVTEVKTNPEVIAIMGSLYNDRLYLERLYKEADETSRTGRQIKERAYSMIEYIDKQMVRKFRTELSGERKYRTEPLITAFQLKKQINLSVTRELSLIDLEQREGRYEDSLERCEQLLHSVLTHPRVSKLEEVIATIYGFLGNAHLKLDDLANAFVYFSKEKDLSNRHHLENTKLHSLHCLGVVSVLRKEFKKATKIWTIRLSYAKTAEEKCWLQHEIARCHFAMNNWIKAHANAQKAYKETLQTQDPQWQLNCLVLLAQIETRLPNLDHAIINYGKALIFAQKLEDTELIEGIECALKDLKNQQILIANNQSLQEHESHKPIATQTKKIEYLSAEEVLRARRVVSSASMSGSQAKVDSKPQLQERKDEKEVNGEKIELLDGKQYNHFFGNFDRIADEKYAFVTMATNNTYAVSALVLAETLKNTDTKHDLVAIVTEEVHEEVMRLLKEVFTRVEVVNVIDSQDEESLSLLQRHELGVTFTKLHSWRLTQYDKCVFLDADTIVLQNIDDLFERDPFAAAPDSGWPDCFNSGVFLYRPSLEMFQTLLDFAFKVGSFDGGDQGLLNLFFSDWSTKDIKFHLPVTYNLPWHSFYSYKPALKQYGHQVKVIHFIGSSKPWTYEWDPVLERVLCQPEQVSFNNELLQVWWDVFMSDVKNKLPAEVLGKVGNFSRLKVRGITSHAETLLLHKQRELIWEEGNKTPDKANESNKKDESRVESNMNELVPLVCVNLSQLPPELLKKQSSQIRASKKL